MGLPVAMAFMLVIVATLQCNQLGAKHRTITTSIHNRNINIQEASKRKNKKLSEHRDLNLILKGSKRPCNKRFKKCQRRSSSERLLGIAIEKAMH